MNQIIRGPCSNAALYLAAVFLMNYDHGTENDSERSHR